MEAEKKTRARKPAAKRTGGEPPTERAAAFDPVEAVLAKYRDFSWVVFRAPKDSINDIIAQKDKKFHFVQVVTEDNIDDAKYSGIQKNTFIQNAFSNSALPIYAHVVKTTRRGENNTRQIRANVTFENVNESVRVIIGGKKTQLVQSAPCAQNTNAGDKNNTDSGRACDKKRN